MEINAKQFNNTMAGIYSSPAQVIHDDITKWVKLIDIIMQPFVQSYW